jgi:hypothetical protein
VHDHQEKLLAKGEHVSTNSKTIALVVMYIFFITEINLSEAIRKLQNKATTTNLQCSSRVNKATSTKLPIRCEQCKFYVCADEGDFIVSKSFTSGQRFSKPLQT